MGKSKQNFQITHYNLALAKAYSLSAISDKFGGQKSAT